MSSPVIYGISDTHGHLPDNIPTCDILIHAGDVGPDLWQRGQWFRHYPEDFLLWFKEMWFPWASNLIENEVVRDIVFTWGNHDWTQTQQLTKEIRALLGSPEENHIHLLVDAEVTIDDLRIWGSPWSNFFNDWSWMDSDTRLGKLRYAQVPEGIDILISHQPPAGYGGGFYDSFRGRYMSVGSVSLLDTILRAKPKAVVCGHIHGGFGRYLIPDTNTVVYNVSLLDEAYTLVNDPTRIEFLGDIPV